jgi:hypothetical protein
MELITFHSIPLANKYLFNFVFAYLFEHSLIAVDVNQSLHENWGGIFSVHTFQMKHTEHVLAARSSDDMVDFRIQRQLIALGWQYSGLA